MSTVVGGLFNSSIGEKGEIARAVAEEISTDDGEFTVGPIGTGIVDDGAAVHTEFRAGNTTGEGLVGLQEWRDRRFLGLSYLML